MQTAERVEVVIVGTRVLVVRTMRRSATGNGTETVDRILRADENLLDVVKVVDRTVGRRILIEANETVGIDMGIVAGETVTVIGTGTTSGIGMERGNGSVVGAGERKRGRGSVIEIESVTGTGIGATRIEEIGRRKVVAVVAEGQAGVVEVEERGRRLRRWTREAYLSDRRLRRGRGTMRTWARGGEQQMTTYVSKFIPLSHFCKSDGNMLCFLSQSERATKRPARKDSHHEDRSMRSSDREHDRGRDSDRRKKDRDPPEPSSSDNRPLSIDTKVRFTLSELI